MRRPSTVATVVSATVVLVTLPATTNVVTGALPASWEPYLWLAWPLLLSSAMVAVVGEVRRRSAAAGPGPGSGTGTPSPDVRPAGRRSHRSDQDVIVRPRGELTDVDLRAEGRSRQQIDIGDDAVARGITMVSTVGSPAVPSPSAPPPPSPALAPQPAPALAPAPAPAPEPAPAVESTLFVGRDHEIQEVFGRLGAVADGVVFDVVGMPGAGKTTLLHRIVDRAREQPDLLVRQIDLAEFRDGHRDDRGPDASTRVLSHTFTRSVKLMGMLAGDHWRRMTDVALRAEAGRKATEVAFDSTVNIGAGARVDGLTLFSQMSENYTGDSVSQRLKDAQEALDEAFSRAWAELTRHAPALITFDPLDAFLDDEFGAWLRRFALRLPRTVTVFAWAPVPYDVDGGSRRVRCLRLGGLSGSEVTDHLRRRLPGQDISAELAAAVHDLTDGHPGGVDLVGKLILERLPESLRPQTLRGMLSRLPGGSEEQWAEFVDQILATVSERLAVQAAAVPNSFDEPLLAALLATGGEQAAPNVSDLMDSLKRYGLLRPVRTAEGSPTPLVRLHEFIRRSVRHRLRADPRRWQELNSRAADHYFTLLSSEEDGVYDHEYNTWYRYEKPDWQRYEREWLWHSGQLTERRSLTRARFAVVFLEAFWWWGYYHPFDFNRELIEDWELAAAEWQPVTGSFSADQERRRDVQFAVGLRYLLKHYPVGHLKPRDADWDGIADHLRTVRRLCGLAPGTPRRQPGSGDQGPSARPAPTGRDAELARAAGLIDLFLAHTRRYADPADPRADRYYAESREVFADLADTWMLAWLDFEYADLLLERGERETILPWLRRSADEVYAIGIGGDDDWDHELLANLHRLHADLHWARGDRLAAADAYGRAVADAYWLQGAEMVDPYTQRFYAEITGRVAERACALASSMLADSTLASSPDGTDQVLEFVRAVRTRLPYGSPRTPDAELVAVLRHGAAEHAARALFLRGPADHELRSEDTDFMRQWHRAVEDRPDRASSVDPLRGDSRCGCSR